MSAPLDIPEPATLPEPPPEKNPRRNWRRWLLLLLLLLLLLCCACLWIYYFTTRQSFTRVLPVTQVVTKGFKPHYLFSIYGMVEPVGVGVTTIGDRIYVAESGGERLLYAFDRDGEPLFNFAPPKSTPPGRAPVYVAVDRSGTVYVTDRIRRTTDLYDAGGNYQSTLTPPIQDGWQPLSLRYENDTLFFTEVTKGKHRVVIADKSGKLITQFGKEGDGTAPDELLFPNSTAIDVRQRLYVSDSNNGRIKVFDQKGELLFVLTGFSVPRGMAIDSDDRLYVVDAVAHTIKVYDTAKDKVEMLFTFGDFGLNDGEFNYPNDIAIDGTGRLYIADRVNNRIQVWVY